MWAARTRWAGAPAVLVLATAPAAGAAPSPPAVYRALAARTTWTAALPPRFTVARAVAYPSHDPGFVGRVFLFLRGPLAGQGLGFVVAQSAGTAEADLLGFVRDRQGKQRADEPAGSYWWTDVATGGDSQCDSPRVRCHETSLATRLRNVVVVATVGSARRGSGTATRDLRRLYLAALARLRSLGV